jgi:hypothetical protein
MLPAKNGLLELSGTAPLFLRLRRKALSVRVEMHPEVNNKDGNAKAKQRALMRVLWFRRLMT